MGNFYCTIKTDIFLFLLTFNFDIYDNPVNFLIVISIHMFDPLLYFQSKRDLHVHCITVQNTLGVWTGLESDQVGMYIIYFYVLLHSSPSKTLESMSEATKIHSVFIFNKISNFGEEYSQIFPILSMNMLILTSHKDMKLQLFSN